MDRNILAALANQERFKGLRSCVPDAMLTPETQVMLQWYALYFQTYPGRQAIDPDELSSLVRLRSSDANPESLAITLHMVEQLKVPVDDTALNGILTQLYELDTVGRLGALLARYHNNEEIDIVAEAKRVSDEAMRSMGNSSHEKYCDLSIGQILSEVQGDAGIKFRRIAALRESIQGLQGGASIAVGGRPDKGKTSLLADVLTDFAPQCVEFFGGDRPILWLCNEGTAKRIVPRIYQAALGKDLNEIIEMSNAGTLEDAYMQAIGGPLDYIRVKDAHGMSLPQVERVIEAMRPCLVVYDMLANFKLGRSNGSNKADEVEGLWQTVRELAVNKDHIAMGTIQISAPGDNDLYPPYTFLKDSQTAVQGAVDIILMLGALNSIEYQAMRGISTPKNKFAVPGKPSYVKQQLSFDAARCRFTESASTPVSAATPTQASAPVSIPQPAAQPPGVPQ